MDSRLTKQRLNDHFGYDWMKYIGLIAAVVMLLSLVFTMTSPRLHKGRVLEIIFASQHGVYPSDLNNFGGAVLGKVNPNDSKDSQFEVHVNSYNIGDSQIMQAYSVRIQAGEGDVLVSEALITKTYIDQQIIYPLGDAISEAIALGNNLFNTESADSRRQFQNFAGKTIKDEEKLIQEMQDENTRRLHYQSVAQQLNEFFSENPEYGLMYRRGEQWNEVGDGETIELGEEKLWALSFTPMLESMKAGGFIYVPSAPTEKQLEEGILEQAAALMSRKRDNGPYFYESLTALLHIIQAYGPAAG